MTLPGAPAALLDLLLERSRTSGDARLSPLIERLGDAIAPASPPRPEKSKARASALAGAFDGSALHVSATVKEVEAFAQLLETTQMLSMLGPIISAWEIHHRDPRLATAALALLRRHPRTLPTTVISRLVGALFRHADDSHALGDYIDERSRPEQQRQNLRPWPNTLRTLLKRSQKSRKVVAVSETELRQLTRAVAAIKPKPLAGAQPTRDSPGEEDALIEAVVSSPDDDAPRAAYANWLQGRKRPLGDLIELQLESLHTKLSAAERAEEKRLLKECRTEFNRQFGGTELALHVPSMRVARGFVVSARIRDATVPVAALLERADLSDANISGNLRLSCLREVDAGSIEKAAAIVAGAPRLEQVVVRADVSNHRKARVSAFIRAVRAIPRSVERIGLMGSFVDDREQALEAFLGSKFVRTCRVLSLGSVSVPLDAAMLRAVPSSVERLLFRTEHQYPMLCFGLERSRGQTTAVHVFWEGRFIQDPAPVVSHLTALLEAVKLTRLTWSEADRNVEVFTSALTKLEGISATRRALTPEVFSESVLSLKDR